MAVRKNQPLKSSFAVFAAAASLVGISVTPALAAPDRTICEDAAEPTLDVATTEFSQTSTAVADESVKFPVSEVELATGEDEAVEKAEHAVEEGADSDRGDSALPADAGPIVYKRQMYRRDI